MLVLFDLLLAILAAELLTAVHGEITLQLAHWNPHWQCFVDQPSCLAGASSAVTKLLTLGVGDELNRLDFASLIEFELPKYVPPHGWATVGALESCGQDWATLFYNSKRWALVGESTVGCLAEGRSFALGTFVAVTDPSLRLNVVSAHYPQTLRNATSYWDATTHLRNALARRGGAATATVVMADTNTEGPEAAAVRPDHHGTNKTNGELLFDLGIWSDPTVEPPMSPLYKGCCFDDIPAPFAWQGDRIVANRGEARGSAILFDPVPLWASFNGSHGNEFHKGVTLTLRLPSART